MSRPKLAQEAAATVVEQLPRLLFRVALEDHRQLLCHVAGKLRKKLCSPASGGPSPGGAVAAGFGPWAHRMQGDVGARVAG